MISGRCALLFLAARAVVFGRDFGYNPMDYDRGRVCDCDFDCVE